MKGYIDLILGGLPKAMDRVAVTPATSNLFRTNNDGVPLSEEQKDLYHHVTMQLSYLAQKQKYIQVEGVNDSRLLVNALDG